MGHFFRRTVTQEYDRCIVSFPSMSSQMLSAMASCSGLVVLHLNSEYLI